MKLRTALPALALALSGLALACNTTPDGSQGTNNAPDAIADSATLTQALPNGAQRDSASIADFLRVSKAQCLENARSQYPKASDAQREKFCDCVVARVAPYMDMASQNSNPATNAQKKAEAMQASASADSACAAELSR